MAYNYYPNYMFPTQSNAYPTQSNALTWVSGEAGAKAYMVAPNQTVVLWDSEAQVIYLKSADSTGMPSVKVLDYTIRDSSSQKADILAQKDFATKDDVDYLKKEINALKARFKKGEDK